MSIPRPKFNRLWQQTEGHCVYCDRTPRDDQKTSDHVWPKSLGGTKHLKNLIPACGTCNRRRAVAWPPSSLAHPKWKQYVADKEQSDYVQDLKDKQYRRQKKIAPLVLNAKDPVAAMATYLADQIDKEREQRLAAERRFLESQRRENQHWAQKREEARLERKRKKAEELARKKAPLMHQPFASLFPDISTP